MKRYLEWAKHEYSLRQLVFTLILAGFLFLLILPYLLINSSAAIDQRLHLPKISAGAANPVTGVILIIGGISLAWWSIYAQITLGRGTPLPVVPTQKLIVKAPFTYCRNPMTLGTFIAYSGIGVWIASLSAVGIVLIFTSLLLLYIKFFEEKELAARFGAEYLAYKQSTPFILPRLRPRKEQ
jgi:protein-S-isoprenylcysteine O-methyltransferase Ste14